jgi:hypothetical protein
MASPGSPSSNPIQVTATPVTVIRIKDNVARVKIGAKYWDVRILEKKTGTNENTVLSMSEDLAAAIEGIFQSLATQAIIDPQTHKKIILEGERKLAAEGAVESVTISKVKVQKDTSDLEEVTSINDAARRALHTLGSTLKDHDLALHTQTTQERADSPPTSTTTPSDRPADAAATNTSSASTVQVAPTYSYTSKPLQEQFSNRNVIEISNPFEEPARIIKRTANDLRLSMAQFIANIGSQGYVFGLFGKSSGNGFDKGEEFNKIKSTLEKINAFNATTLESKAQTLGITLASGQIAELLGSSKEEDKKNLVRIYTECLKDFLLVDQFKDENFYHILNCFLRHSESPIKAFLQFKVLSRDSSHNVKIEKEIPQSHAQPTHTIYLLREGDKLKLFDRNNNPSQNLKNLDQVATLDQSSQIEDTTTDCGAGGRCADLSLADQILKIKGQDSSDDSRSQLANTIRQKVAGKLKDQAFYSDETNFGAIHKALKFHLMAKSDDLKGKIAALNLHIVQNHNQLDANVFENIEALDVQAQNTLHGIIHQKCKEQLNSQTDSSNPQFGKMCLEFAKSSRTDTLEFNDASTLTKDVAKSVIIEALKELANNPLPQDQAFESMDITEEQNKKQIAEKFARVIEGEFNSFFDEICFKALSECEIDLQSIGGQVNEKFSVAVFQNARAPSADKPLAPPLIYGSEPHAKDRTLCIWYNGKDHYRSIKRSEEFFRRLTIN